MLTEHQAGQLLDSLCVKLGFCLEPEPYTSLCMNPPSNPESFADAVMEAEGLSSAPKRLRPQVLEYAVAAFERASRSR